MSLKSVVKKIPGYNSLVKPLHYEQALVAGMKYGWPAKNLRVIGVTGTNGKTTTSFMIWKMLNESGHKCGILSTVGWATGADDLHQQVEHMTTERVEVLNERMRAVADAKAEFLVLEVTSHALSQSRILGVPIEIAVFTNLAHEHLDYHGTLEKYRAAKLKLFKKSKFGVINADDANSRFFQDIYSFGDMLTYGIERGELRATDIELKSTGVEYSCGDIKIETQIPGKFNVYNSLAAVGVGKKLGLTNAQIEHGIASLKSVEGRMTRVQEGQDFEVIVDYAHVPDALENVFASVISSSDSLVRSHRTLSTAPLRASNLPRTNSERETFSENNLRSDRRIISVHGGAGQRDSSTREPRGEILGKYSDIVIVTEDDSRDEDPAEIAQMFVDGAVKAGKTLGKDLFVELDRRKAIEKAISMAGTGDLVLLLGKGHEKTILRADGPHDFEDIKVAQEVLREKK